MYLSVEGVYQERPQGREWSIISLHDQDRGELMIWKFGVNTI